MTEAPVQGVAIKKLRVFVHRAKKDQREIFFLESVAKGSFQRTCAQ